MRQPLPVLVALLLAATPAAAVSVSVASCNDHAAELTDGRDGWRLVVDGEEVPLAGEASEWDGLVCVTRDGRTSFGLIALSPEGDESYFVVAPGSGRLEPISGEEAEALGFWDTEDDWLGGDED